MQRLSARFTLPKDAKSVGSYAFYNCRSLERIELTGSVSEFGGGALMNCMSLREVILHAAPSAPTCLPRLLGEYAGELDVRFDEHARLLFPEYVEELEDPQSGAYFSAAHSRCRIQLPSVL